MQGKICFIHSIFSDINGGASLIKKDLKDQMKDTNWDKLANGSRGDESKGDDIA